MRTRHGLLVAAAVAVLAGCSATAAEPLPATTATSPPATTTGRTLTAITYNVRGDVRTTPPRREPGDPASYADVIAAQQADVAGLQEISRDEARAVTRALGWGDSCAGAPTCAHTTVDFLSGEGTAIVSRHRFVRPPAQWLLADSPGDHPRYLQRVTIAPDGPQMNVYNTHLTHLDAVPREAQARDIARIVADDLQRTGVGSYVLLGDLNAKPGDTSAETLERSATDACAEQDCGNTIPARDNRHQTRATPVARVDHVLVSRRGGLTPREAHVPDPDALVPRRDGSAPAMRYWQVSDHLPVVARISLPR